LNEWRLNQVITAMKKSHPYEEVAFDVFPLKNDNVNYGIGAAGELATEMGTKDFLKFVSSKLKTSDLRYSLGKRSKIKNVAVCGGSCGELVDEAIKQNADAFITADIKYHTFQEIDAGHYETEVPILDEIKSRLDSLLKADGKTKVLKFKGSTNPVFFYNKSGAN